MAMSLAFHGLIFAAALCPLAMLPGRAQAADDGAPCCVERVAMGQPLAPDKALRVRPPAPAPDVAPGLKLTLKIVVEVEVRRVFRVRPSSPATSPTHDLAGVP